MHQVGAYHPQEEKQRQQQGEGEGEAEAVGEVPYFAENFIGDANLGRMNKDRETPGSVAGDLQVAVGAQCTPEFMDFCAQAPREGHEHQQPHYHDHHHPNQHQHQQTEAAPKPRKGGFPLSRICHSPPDVDIMMRSHCWRYIQAAVPGPSMKMSSWQPPSFSTTPPTYMHSEAAYRGGRTHR